MMTLARRTILLGSPLLSVLAQTQPARACDGNMRKRVPAALPELERVARQAVKNGDVPGLAVAVVHRDEVVYLEGFGVRAADKPDLINADTVFQLASCSKPIASTVVAALVGEKRLSWDARISDIDPGFRLHDPYPTAEVTVTDLFAHRSGLPGGAGNELEEIGYSRDEIRRRLRLVPPSSSFRAGYSYSNSGLTEGAVAAAKAAGMTWEDAAEQKLFEPLGMTSTSARYRDFKARTDRASLHIRTNGRWVASQQRNADVESPAGGISSSARDMAQWMRLQLAGGLLGDRRVIEAAALARTHEPVIARGNNPITGLPEFYGLGWGLHYGPRGVVWTHSGAFSQGAQTNVTLIPADQLGIVVLTNGFPSGVADGLAEVFTDIVDGKQPKAAEQIAVWTGIYTSLFGQPTELSQALYGKAPVSPSPPLPASAYVGSYSNAYLGAARVTKADGAMRLKLGPEGAFDLPLTHYDRDLFTVVFSPELPDLRSAVTFRVGPGGKASSVTIESLDETGLGTLTRTGA
jgi:CubicO group peptidase (beta-lactamase class C family)